MKKVYHTVPADAVIGALPIERKARIKSRAKALIASEVSTFATADLTEAEVKEVTKARMHARHDHLDQLLDDNSPD